MYRFTGALNRLISWKGKQDPAFPVRVTVLPFITNPDDVETEKLATSELMIPYGHEIFQPPVISIPAIAKPGRVLLMILAVQYMVNNKNGIQLLNDFKKLPCGVVWAGRL